MDLEQFAGLPKGEYQLAQDGSSFVYALNEEGTNRFWLKVDPGWAADGSRTPYEDVMVLARAIVALPALLSELAAARAEIERLKAKLKSYDAGMECLNAERHASRDEAARYRAAFDDAMSIIEAYEAREFKARAANWTPTYGDTMDRLRKLLPAKGVR